MAAGEHDPFFNVSVAVGLSQLTHQALANHDFPGHNHEKCPEFFPRDAAFKDVESGAVLQNSGKECEENSEVGSWNEYTEMICKLAVVAHERK